MPNQGILTVSTDGNTDTEGRLFNSQGEQLITDDNSGTQQNFNISTELEQGTYYLRIGTFGENPGDYFLNTAFIPLQESSCNPESGIDCTANYSASEQIVTIPCIVVPGMGTFEAALKLIPDSDPLRFTLADLKPVSDDCAGKPSLYLPDFRSLHIPEIKIPGLGTAWEATLDWLEGTEKPEFTLQEAKQPEDNLPLINKIRQAIVDKIGDSLENRCEPGKRSGGE